jgi:hypothetical protein
LLTGMPGTFNRQRVTNAGSARMEQALAAWRGICRAEHSGSKADFAHRLAARLDVTGTPGGRPTAFAVPAYILDAVEHVHSRLDAPTSTTTANAV